MNDKFRAILDGLPEKPSRSRLEPYSELIDELRRRRWTYREIVTVLAEKCGLRVSISTLHGFVRGKSKEAKKAAKLLRTMAPGIARVDVGSASPGRSTGKESAPTADEVQQRIAALKGRPVPRPANPSKEFQYDPDEPLRLVTETRKP